MPRTIFMMRILIGSILLLALCAPIGAQSGAGILPVGPGSHSFLYDRMEWNAAVSLDRFDHQLGPYSLESFQLDNTPFADLANVSGTQLAIFSSIGENFRSTKYSRASALEAVRGGIALRPLDKLFVYGNFILDEGRAKDPSYLGKKWRGLAGDVEQAFAVWQTERLDLMVGRFASFWGNQRSLVLGPNVSLDGFGYSYRWGRLTVSYRLARLDPIRRSVDTTTEVENRYFAGHRFDLHLSDRVRIGLFETVVFGGPGRQIELFYLNPLIFFHGSQVNEGANDNTFVGFDFSIKPLVGLHLYGQALIDDYQVEKKSQGDQEPNEYGLLVGGYAADVLPECDIRFEYSRVTNWTFNQNLSRNRYLFNNQLISGAAGNDYDLVDLAVIRWLGEQSSLSGRVSVYRQGEGNVRATWDEPWMQAEGKYDEPFPTGSVQQTTTYAIGYQGYFGKMLAFDMQAGIDRVTNYRHLAGENRTRPFIHFEISALFCTIADVQ